MDYYRLFHCTERINLYLHGIRDPRDDFHIQVGHSETVDTPNQNITIYPNMLVP